MRVFVPLVLLMSFVNANACECAARLVGTVSDDYLNAETLIVAEIVKRVDIQPPSETKWDGDVATIFVTGLGLTIVIARTVELIKDRTHSLPLDLKYPTYVYLLESPSGCGFHFEVGKRYLIDAKRISGGLFATGQCTLTSEVSMPNPLLDQLRQMKATLKEIEKQ